MADQRGDAMRRQKQQQPFGPGQERAFDGGGIGGPAFGDDYDHASSSYMALLGTGVNNPQPLPPPPPAWAVEEVTSATPINLTPQFSMANYAPPPSSYQQNPASFVSPFAAANLHNPYQPPSTTYNFHADPPPQWPPRPPSSLPPRGNFALQHEQQQQQQNMHMQLLRALGPQSSSPAAAPIEQPGKDGYNWRKYGQKQLKDAESPRSYYKCTREGCPVKKIVERSFDGSIKEITYKGRHTHPRPPEPRRGGATRVEDNVAAGSSAGAEEEEDYGDQLPSDDEDTLHEDDGEEGQDRAAAGGGAAPGQRVVKKHKIILQTPSEVDLLDDGYRWRKYGQKVVKGNPRPRSYYKCTAENCNVRKQIERASSNPSCVMTTYTGRHSHDPPGRATGGAAAAAAGGGSSPVPTPRQLKEESRD